MRLLSTNVGWRKARRMARVASAYLKSYLFFQGWRTYVWREGGPVRLAAFWGPRRGHRQFCADPFLFRRDGVNYLFYETVDRREKGFIGCLKEADDGSWTDLGAVLREPWHLSYPQVFEEDGRVFMIPESCDFGRGSVALYEAVAFPLKWRRVTTLIDRPFADATILKHEGHWYMACYTIPPHESAELWHAPTLTGPWSRHPRWNGINQSKRLRRCGGSYIRRGDALYRVAQDCNGPLYGKRLFRVAVKRISPTDYEEGEATLLHDRSMPPYAHCHTYNEIQGGGMCVVDVHHDVLEHPVVFLRKLARAGRKVLRKIGSAWRG